MYGPGPTYENDTHHTYIGWGATLKSCVGFRMSKFPHMLLKKLEMTGSLS